MTTTSKRPASTKPLVSIVVPVFNDEEYIERSLGTAINQSLKNIEIICVDDCSTDDSVKIIEKYTKKDSRVKLIQLKKNSSAFQARLTGIKSASADYILFLDGDDELHKDAAKLSHRQAVKSRSDIVGYGSKIIRQDGTSSKEFEKSLQPLHKKLIGSDIVAKLFKPDRPAQGSMWRYLFSKKLLLDAYSYFPKNQQIYRTNDLPISFLCASLAKKYTSINNKLYTYHFYAGGSGGSGFTLEKFKFYTKAIDSVDLLGKIINKSKFSEVTKESYLSARLFVLSNILRQIENNLPLMYHKQAMRYLMKRVSLDDIVMAMANFIPEALHTIRDNLPSKTSPKTSKNIALYTNNLSTGGVQGVVISQAKYLRDAGFKVIIVVLNEDQTAFKLPKGVKLEGVKKGPIYIRLRSFKSILQKHKIDTVIDHNVLYNFSWPYFNLIAKSLSIKTVSWIHSFSLRPMVEGNTNGRFLNENICLIDDLVVLSKHDVSYWKSLGHKNVYYIPNPPSPLLLENREKIEAKKAPKNHLNIIWFGRLQQSTKRVYSLLEIAAELKKLTNNFTLKIIGPESIDLTFRDLKGRVKSKNLSDVVKVVGPKHGTELINELKGADVFLSTSVIEGYLLTLIEAQSYALPVVMYELPWLVAAENNKGILQTPQQDAAEAAQKLYDLFTAQQFYEDTSKASITASDSYLSYDFAKLYTQLLQHRLPKEFSPEISIDHLAIFTRWSQFYFAELIDNGNFTLNISVLKRKDAEIRSLKNSKAMKVGNAIAKPVRKAKIINRKLAKHLKNR